MTRIGCAAYRHIVGGEVRDRFTKDHGEVNGTAIGRIALPAGLVNRDRGAGGIRREGDGVIRGRRGTIGIAHTIGGDIRANGSDDEATSGHACDGHVVGGATAGDRAGGRPGCAAYRHIVGGEVRDRFTKDHGEVNGTAIGRIELAHRLVNRDRGAGGIRREGDGVIENGGDTVRVPEPIGRDASRNVEDDRSRARHITDRHVVGGATAGDRAGGRPGCAAYCHIAGGEVRDRFTKDHGEVNGTAIGRIALPAGLVNRDRGAGGIRREGDGVIRGHRGTVGIAHTIGGDIRANGSDDEATSGHACDGHVVGGATAGDRAGGRPGCAAYRHIVGGEVRDRFTKDHGEVNGTAIGRIALPAGLVNRDRGAGGIRREGDGVIENGGDTVRVPEPIGRDASRNVEDDRSRARHITDRHVVGGATAGDRAGGRPGCAA